MLDREQATLAPKTLPPASAEFRGEGGGPVYGRVEVLSERLVTGWAFVRDQQPIFVTCTFDGAQVGGTIANTVRSDVSAGAPFAPANCGFTLQLDAKPLLSLCEDFEDLKRRLRFEVDDRAQLEFHCVDPYETTYRSTSETSLVRGHLDGLFDGEIRGWCIEEGAEAPTSLHVLIDGVLQADIECAEHRSDLHSLLGINHGGFSFEVPRKFHDGRPHTIRCQSLSGRCELQGSPIEFQFRTEADVIQSEVHAFAEACGRVETELARMRRSFGQYILKKGPFLAGYRYVQPTMAASATTRSRLMRLARETTDGGVMSIILPTYKSDLTLLAAAIDSVVAQTDPHWELVISDSASVDGPLKALLEARVAMDDRIKLVSSPRQLGISDNSNQALKAATGTIVGFLDHDDTLAPEAVFLMRQAFATGRYDLVYSDEDKINTAGEYVEPHYKSAMNFDLLMAMNYMCHFVGVRRSVLEQTKGFRSEFDGAQDWDLILQVIGRVGNERVGHIPRVLYHWRMTDLSTASSSGNKSYAVDAGIAAVNAFLSNQGYDARAAKAAGHLPYVEVSWRPAQTARLSIIVPTKDKLDLVLHCISSLQASTGGIDYEVLIVDNGSSARSVRGFEKIVASNPRVRLIGYGGAFNYSAINNYAVKSAKYENLLFLNNDVFFIDNGWAQKMLGIAGRKDVGAVGLKLLYPDNTVQHCGVVLGNGGIAGHAFSHVDESETGYYARAALDYQVSAVTAACVLMRRSVFEEVGGFESEGLPVAFNDIDLCMRIHERGYANVLVATRFAYHAESKSRGFEDTPEKIERFNREIDFMKKRWGDKLSRDRYYSPNFDIMHAPYQRIATDAIIEQEFAMGEVSIVR